MNLQDEIAHQLDQQMQKEIDREILWGMLKEMGWTRITLDRFTDNKHAIDITYWLMDNVKNPYHREGRDFIFEDSREAMMFILKWV